jgi:hypothetical protein
MEWMVSVTPRPRFTLGNETPVPITLEAGRSRSTKGFINVSRSENFRPYKTYRTESRGRAVNTPAVEGSGLI